jgi:charged multivesicular body protein 4
VLELRIDKLERDMESELRKAQEAMGRKNKAGALMCMRKRKMYEASKQAAEGQLVRVTQTIISLEAIIPEQQVLAVTKAAVDAMKKTIAVAGPDAVNDVMDDLDDVIAQHREVQERLAQGAPDEAEDELLAELDELTVEEDELAALGAEEQPLPAVPTRVPVVKQPAVAQPAARAAAQQRSTAEEDAELEALQAEFA